MRKNSIVVKTLLIATATLAITSCGTKNMTPDQALLENQKSIVKNFENLGFDIQLGNIKSDIKLAFKNSEGEGKGELNLDFNYDNKKILSSGDIKASGDFKANDESGSANLALSMITTKEKIFAKLNDLGINMGGEDSEESKAMMMMAQAYIGKWFHFALPPEIVEQYNKNDTKVLQQFTVVLKTLNKYALLKVVKEYENPIFFDLDVELNKENIIKIIKEINQELGNDTEVNVEEINKSIDNSNFNANIKINRKNPSYFVLELIKKSDISSQIKINNSDSKITFTVKEGDNKVNIDLSKSGNKYTGPISSVRGEEKELDGTLNIELGKNTLSLGGKFNLPQETTLDIDTKTSIVKLDKVEITEPTDSTDFQQVMMGLMGGGM